MKRALLAFVFTLASTLLGAAAAEKQTQRVILTVVSRCGTSVVLEDADLSTKDGHQAAIIPLVRIGTYFYRGEAAAEPGTYDVGLDIPKKKCWGGTKLHILRGHDRTAGIVVSPLGPGHYDAYDFVYGTLPFAGFLRGTLMGKSFDQAVEIDHDAYYVEHAYPGSYVLRLFYDNSLECRLPITIPQDGIRIDVSVEQAERCIGFPYRYQSTGESGFMPLFPSPSPSP